MSSVDNAAVSGGIISYLSSSLVTMAMTSDNYNQDYRSPRTMTSAPGQNGPPHQLDFYQAMADFRHMFPNMEEEVIEAVLRSNNGAVDATIDQLLTMNAENNGGNTENKSTKPGPDNQGTSPAPPPYPTGAAEMPPSYQDYTKSVEQATQTQVSPEKPEPVDKFLLDIPVPAAESAENDELSAKGDEVLGATGGKAASRNHLPTLQIKGHSVTSDDAPSSAEPLSAPVPQVPIKMPLFNHNYTPAHSLTPKRLYKGWTPGLLGQLPDDFLRITITTPAECHHCHHHTQSSPSSMSSSSPNTPPIQRSKLRRSKPGSQNSSPRPASVGSRSPRPLHASGQEELSSEMIQQRMMENERKRSLHADTDPAALQMLEDERLALMLQNEEFLTELMSDEDFLTTLERDRMNATAFEPPLQHDTPELGPEGPRPDYIEGYGDDRDVTLGAFPFDRSVPGVKERDRKAEFRRQLNNMGGSSKKKLVAAAKRFFSRKKKSSKQLYPYPGYELPIEFKGYNNLDDPSHTSYSRDTGQDLYFQNQYAL